jgi:mono/diheme cytochrome c family protein
VTGRPLLIATALIAGALSLGACGSEGIQVSEDDPAYTGAELFSQRCSGCHTLTAAGASGSANRAVRNQGPNLDERVESPEDVLFAIQNGGFSGAIMPQNVLVGEDADAVADFVAEYAGSKVDRPPSPQALDAAASDEGAAASPESP